MADPMTMTAASMGLSFPFVRGDHESRQVMFFAVMGVLFLLSTITVALRYVEKAAEIPSQPKNKRLIVYRMYCRMGLVRHVGMDDYFICAAWAVTCALCIMNVFHVSYGTG